MPEYKTAGAAGFDLYIRGNEKWEPGEFKVVPANLVVAVPKGHFLLINSRGSTAKKFGLLVIPGILDEDFCGDEDEIHIQVLNFSKKRVEIAQGTRIAQGIFVKISKPGLTEVTKMNSKSRGMMGTTGY